MNRAVFIAVVLATLALAPYGYAEKTRVEPVNVKLLGEAAPLSLVGVQSDGQFIVSGDFDLIDGMVHRNFARITADGRLDSPWGYNIFIFTSLRMDGDDVYAVWVDGAGNRNITWLNEHGVVGTNWIYTTTNNFELLGVNGTGVFVGNDLLLIKLNKHTGVAEWSYTNSYTNSYSSISIVLIDDMAVYLNVPQSWSGNEINKINNLTGEREWVVILGDDSIFGNDSLSGFVSDGMSLYYRGRPTYPPDYISRIDITSGILDSNWLCRANGWISSLAVDETGVYVGGYFTEIGGSARSGLAKIDKTNARAIADWNVAVPGLNITALQTDGTSIYAIGSADTNYLARIDKMTGTIDWAIPLNGYNPVAITVTGASVFVTALNSNSTTCFAKFDKTTGAMQAFLGEHPSYNSGTATCLARQSDGKMYVGGDFVGVNETPRLKRVRLNVDGSVDDGWRCDEQRRDATAIAVDDTGVYVASFYPGGHLRSGSSIISKVTKLSDTVTNWQYYIYSYYHSARTHAIVVDDDYVYVGGDFDADDTAYGAFIIKLNKMTGEVDSRWNPREYKSGSRYGRDREPVSGLVVDGNFIYVGGVFSEIGGRRRNHIAKLDKISGQADADWNAQWPFSGSLTIGAIAVDGSSVYVAGYVTDDDYHPYYGGIAKLDKATGRADPAWHCTADDSIDCLAIENCWLYAGGGFQTIGGAARSRVARLNKITGKPDPKWIHNTDGDVAALLVTNGICYLAGSFTKIGLQDHIGFGAILPQSPFTPGDYDGDLIADLALYNPSTGQWLIKLSSVENTPGNFSMTSGSSWIPVRGDFDGDSRTDPALYSPDLGQFVVRASTNDYREYSVSLGGSGCIPVPGDYDNDGATDFMVCLPERGLWTGLLSSSGFSPVALPVLGGPGWTPLTGDFNGDGSCDPAVYNELTGQWRVLDSSQNYLEIDLALTLGGFGFQAMSGDFDGDGLDDFAVYSPVLGEWDIALSALGYAKVSGIFGGEEYTPIPGDYDGDGITDIGVYSALQGQGIAILSSRLGEQVQIPLGGPGYRPCNP